MALMDSGRVKPVLSLSSHPVLALVSWLFVLKQANFLKAMEAVIYN